MDQRRRRSRSRSRSSSRNRRRPRASSGLLSFGGLQRLLFLGLLGGFVAVAAISLYGADGSRRWVNFARTIERSSDLPRVSDVVGNRLGDRLSQSSKEDCYFQTAPAKVTVAIFLMQRAAVMNAPPAERTEAVLTARKVTEEALACRPTDGNLWLALAAVEKLTGAPPARIWSRIGTSIRTSPAEAGQMRQRWIMAGSLPLPPPAEEMPVSRLILVSDLTSTLEELLLKDARDVARGLCQSRNADLLREALDSVSDKRRTELTPACPGELATAGA